MLRLFALWTGILMFVAAQSQADSSGVNRLLLEHSLRVLAADSMKGRGNYTPELKKAAAFIQNEFRAAGLLPYFSGGSYLQFFNEGPIVPSLLARMDSANYESDKVLANVVAVLPGTTHAGDTLIFSAHYDHVGTEPGSSRYDGIYNGANDNASGTAALLALAHYFAERKNNARTLVFCAFAGEELGLVGSRHFAPMVDAKKVLAVVNLEMLGRHGAAGINSFFITGTRYSTLPDIFKKALAGAQVKLKREVYSEYGDLFLRSDNYPFARRGIPAHTVMSSDDSERCYHRPCDDWKSINEKHLLNVTNGIITATRTLVSGADQPVMKVVPK